MVARSASVSLALFNAALTISRARWGVRLPRSRARMVSISRSSGILFSPSGYSPPANQFGYLSLVPRGVENHRAGDEPENQCRNVKRYQRFHSTPSLSANVLPHLDTPRNILARHNLNILPALGRDRHTNPHH